jgi:hypothetical protein
MFMKQRANHRLKERGNQYTRPTFSSSLCAEPVERARVCSLDGVSMTIGQLARDRSHSAHTMAAEPSDTLVYCSAPWLRYERQVIMWRFVCIRHRCEVDSQWEVVSASRLLRMV